MSNIHAEAMPVSEPAKLKGTAAKLAKLIEEKGDYEFEGFKWLMGNYDPIAKELGVHKSTITTITAKLPFKTLAKQSKEYGRFVLIRIGTEKTETDHVFTLRKIWVTGLLYFNDAFVKIETANIEWHKSQGADPKFYERIQHKIAKAAKDAKDLAKLTAGEEISLQVKPAQMGLLRGIVQALGEDAPNTLFRLLTYEGWRTFAAYLKAADREKHHAHWPRLDWIRKHPDIALEAYIDTCPPNQKPDLKETARLNAKIAKLAPMPAPDPAG